MSLKIKELMVKEYARRFSGLEGQGCVLLDYQGLDANAAGEVRKILGEHKSEMFVVRNRLMKLSLEQMGMPQLKDSLRGPTAIVRGEDPVQAAKAVFRAKEQYPAVAVLGGYAEGKVLGESDVEKLSDIPDRDVLLGQALGLFSAPAQQLVNGLHSAMAGFASVLHGLKLKKEEDGAGT